MAEKVKWTKAQSRAIEHRGKDILVTASAGTGKTAVLSERCVNIVVDKKNRCSVQDILVVTFTDMAAEEMRSRIAAKLKQAWLKDGDSYIRLQMMLLQAADISTIHSFCKRLITEYFYRLGIDPTFRVMDPDEQQLMKMEVLDRTVDWAWQQGDLVMGLEKLLCKRNLKKDGFFNNIVHVSVFLDGVASRKNWLDRALLLTEASIQEIAEKQKTVISAKIKEVIEQIKYAQKIYKENCLDGDWLGKCNEKFVEPIEACLEFLQADNWIKCTERIRDYSKPRVNKPKDVDEQTADIIAGNVRAAIDKFVELRDLAIINPDYLEVVGSSANLQTKVFVRLVRKFDELYGKAKRLINCMDFADLEHHALKLLTEEDDNGCTVASQTALDVRKKYKHIFVDEYQDINPVQKTILDMIVGGKNFFAVGDVKQSIYGFRGTEPDIFVEHLAKASPDVENSTDCLRVDLNDNFRSGCAILGFVNDVFGRLMTKSLTKIDYDESAELKPYLKENFNDNASVELHILDEMDKDSNSSQQRDSETIDINDSQQRQAVLIAKRIKKMVGAQTGKAEFEVFDKAENKNRPVRYSDIVILMRSPARRVNKYVEMLALAGIAVSCQEGSGYFEATEISDCLCLLKVLDNRLRDIELAAVLRGPLFVISDSDLAKVKLHSKENQTCKTFYDCLVEYSKTGGDKKLTVEIQAILAKLREWTIPARRGNISDLLWRVYRESGFLAFVSALPNGRQRRANLLKLHERAIQFEGFTSGTVIPSLSRFIDFIEKIEDAGKDWSTASIAEMENTVRIMSVHKSKGLEFPVVFLAELTSNFNVKDLSRDCLVDCDGMLGLEIVKPNSNSKVSTICHQLIAEKKMNSNLAEEMRILYVALTRAREKLILVGCEKKNSCVLKLREGYYFAAERIADWRLKQCKNYMDWILLGLSKKKNVHKLFNTGLTEKCDDESLIEIKFYEQNELVELSGYVDKLRRPSHQKKQKIEKEKKTELFQNIKKAIDWRYEFENVLSLPAKQSVTQLTHRNDEYAAYDCTQALLREPIVISDNAIRIDQREIGIATHLVIAELNLAVSVNEKQIEKIKHQLAADGRISDAAASYVNAESVVGFFESKLGKAAFDKNNKVWREWPFSFAVTAADAGFAGEETIVIQGVIDMLIETADGLLVIDFKTDNISADEVKDRAQIYRRQLELYGRAAKSITGKKNVAKWLYFLKSSVAFEIV